MATTAIATGTHPRRTPRDPRTSVRGLAFDQLGGPLVAVCGLAGGAGTTTLGLLLARHVSARSSAPILLTEADPAHGALAVLAGRATPHPLVDLAQQMANRAAPAETFLELEPGLRMVAATPRHRHAADPDAMRALLGEARAAHGLVIVDCATTWAADSPTLAAATHILWTTAATPAGLARARSLLDSDLMPPIGRCVEALVATAIRPHSRVSVRALRRLAAQRCERLVLIAHSNALARGEPRCDESVAHALSSLAPTLRSAS